MRRTSSNIYSSGQIDGDSPLGGEVHCYGWRFDVRSAAGAFRVVSLRVSDVAGGLWHRVSENFGALVLRWASGMTSAVRPTRAPSCGSGFSGVRVVPTVPAVLVTPTAIQESTPQTERANFELPSLGWRPTAIQESAILATIKRLGRSCPMPQTQLTQTVRIFTTIKRLGRSCFSLGFERWRGGTSAPSVRPTMESLVMGQVVGPRVFAQHLATRPASRRLVM